MKPNQAHASISSLERSKGWQVLHEIMEKEVLAAAMAIAETANMTSEEVNFRRGSIWAAKALLDLPARIKLQLENEVALTRDDKAMPDL